MIMNKHKITENDLKFRMLDAKFEDNIKTISELIIILALDTSNKEIISLIEKKRAYSKYLLEEMDKVA